MTGNHGFQPPGFCVWASPPTPSTSATTSAGATPSSERKWTAAPVPATASAGGSPVKRPSTSTCRSPGVVPLRPARVVMIR